MGGASTLAVVVLFSNRLIEGCPYPRAGTMLDLKCPNHGLVPYLPYFPLLRSPSNRYPPRPLASSRLETTIAIVARIKRHHDPTGTPKSGGLPHLQAPEKEVQRGEADMQRRVQTEWPRVVAGRQRIPLVRVLKRRRGSPARSHRHCSSRHRGSLLK